MSEEKKKSLSAKKYLEQLQQLDTNINQNLERLAEMRADAKSIGSIDYSKERVQKSVAGSRLCHDVTQYVAFDEQINEEIGRFVDAKNQIIYEIRDLHVNNYIQVLFKVYVQFKSIKIAASEMKMSYPYARGVHKKALEMFEETYKNLHYLT